MEYYNRISNILDDMIADVKDIKKTSFINSLKR